MKSGAALSACFVLPQVFRFDNEACNPDEMRRSALPPSRTSAMSIAGPTLDSKGSTSASKDEDKQAQQKSGRQLLDEAKLSESHQDPQVISNHMLLMMMVVMRV